MSVATDSPMALPVRMTLRVLAASYESNTPGGLFVQTFQRSDMDRAGAHIVIPDAERKFSLKAYRNQLQSMLAATNDTSKGAVVEVRPGLYVYSHGEPSFVSIVAHGSQGAENLPLIFRGAINVWRGELRSMFAQLRVMSDRLVQDQSLRTKLNRTPEECIASIKEDIDWIRARSKPHGFPRCQLISRDVFV